jgi:hypothetical protein
MIGAAAAKTPPAVIAVLAVWLTAVLVLGSAGAFAGPSNAPPIAIGLGATLPVATFLVAYATLRSFRRYVLSIDLRLLASIQAWRWAGLGFLTLYAYGVLPALFAWTAGLGDMAIGATAPWIAVALARSSEFADTRRFMSWNLLGILDLVVALGIGALSGVATASMAQMPLVLVPGFLVPFFVILHLTALFQAQQPRQAVKLVAQQELRP